MNRITLILLTLILIAGFGARLYKFSNPLAEWHSWRQVDTASVSKNFVNEGVDLLRPTYHDLSNVPSLIENPNGYRFVEFPIYNLINAVAYEAFGTFSLEQWGRLISIFASLASIVFIFLLLRKYQNETAGLIGAFFYAIIPYSVFYGRTVLPDTLMVATILGAIYFFDLWIEGKKNRITPVYFVASAVLVAIALLLKPFAIFFALPMIYLALRKYNLSSFRRGELYLFALISVIPLLLWRVWMLNFPEGIPQSAWLFNEGNIRFKGAYFFWIFGERIGKLILGYWGLVLFATGLFPKVRKDNLFFYMFLLSSLLYLAVIAKGNVQHDYYQILIIPTIAIFVGLGGDYLIKAKDFSYRFLGLGIFVFCFGLSLILSWYHVRDYYRFNPTILAAGKEVDKLVPKDAKIIANLEGDTTFLYFTNRKGWASYQYDVEGMRRIGAEYLTFLNPRPSDFEYAKGYKVLVQTQEYAIIDLTQKE